MRKNWCGYLSVGGLLFAACAGGLGCTSGDQGKSSSDDLPTTLTETPVPRVMHRLPHGADSTASLRTLPNASCLLHISGEPDDATHQLQLWSDDEGVVRVHLQVSDSGVGQGELLLDCQDVTGATLSHTIEVVADDSAQPQAPAPYVVTGKPTLPILDVDPMSLSDDEIAARHYPPRPNPADSANEDGYSSWLALVTSGPTFITPNLLEDQGTSHSTSQNTSNIWSGYAITSAASAPEYAWIYGEWTVPRAYSESTFAAYDVSTLWVGLDGYGTAGVVQDGTNQNTLTAFWVQTSSYFAWTEWYPAYSQTVSNFPVNPGDDVRMWTWVMDKNQHYSTNPTVGWFYLWNVTQNVAVESSTTAPSGTTFNGHTAEWIMERNSVLGGTIPELAQYAPVKLTNALAVDLSGADHYYTSDNSHQVTMVDNSSGDVLSKVAPVNSSTMQFTWVNHD